MQIDMLRFKTFKSYLFRELYGNQILGIEDDWVHGVFHRVQAKHYCFQVLSEL